MPQAYIIYTARIRYVYCKYTSHSPKAYGFYDYVTSFMSFCHFAALRNGFFLIVPRFYYCRRVKMTGLPRLRDKFLRKKWFHLIFMITFAPFKGIR